MQQAGARPRRPRGWMLFVLGAALALGGCLQDAYNANNGFNFNNPVDPTPTSSSGIVIVELDSGLQIATLVNSSGASQSMAGWTLAEGATVAYTFTSSFVLSANGFVRVHNGTAGTDNGTDVYGATIAYTGTNTVSLFNNSGTLISSCVVGNTC